MLIVLEEGLLQVSASRVSIKYPQDCLDLSLRGVPAHHTTSSGWFSSYLVEKSLSSLIWQIPTRELLNSYSTMGAFQLTMVFQPHPTQPCTMSDPYIKGRFTEDERTPHRFSYPPERYSHIRSDR